MALTGRQDIIVVHAVLGGLLGMILWPATAVAARYMRTYYPHWVRLHYWVGGIISVPVLIVVFALGTAHKQGDPDNWTTAHYRLGLVLLLLGILQPIYGTVIHLKQFHVPVSGPKSILRYFHPVVGITIVILGIVQVYLGFGQWADMKPGPVPHGIIIAWGVLTALWLLLYFAGFVLLPRQWREREHNAVKAPGEKEGYISGVGNDQVGVATDRRGLRSSETSGENRESTTTGPDSTWGSAERVV